MIFPDKLIPFSDSIIAKSIYILLLLNKRSFPVSELYIKTKVYFEDISEFLIALDTLYFLGKINFNDEIQVIEYVKEDTM